MFGLSKDWLVKITLVLIIVLAFFLRFYKVTEDPPSLNWDEVAIGYNAYSIMKTGRDEWNQPWPIHFKSYGEYKLPVQIYGSIPGIAIFGLNEQGVRITPVVYGTLTVLLMFFLGRVLFKSRAVGLLSAFCLAISPWHIQLTRASFESSFSVFWIVMAMWFLIKGFKKPIWLIWSMIPFAISVYTYNSARVFSPLFIFAILIIYRKELFKFKKYLAGAFILFAILMLPLIPFFITTHGTSRYKLVSVTDDPGLVPRIDEARGKSTLPEPLKRLVLNRATYVSVAVVGNYLAHFTPQFLFISGAPHHQHNVQGMGELYYWQAPFLLIGLFLLFKKRHPSRALLIAWILLSIVPVSITNDSIPHALRTLIAAPFYQLIIAFGLYQSWLYLNKKDHWFVPVSVSLLCGTVLISLAIYLANFYLIYPVKYSKDWQYGYKQVVNYLVANQSKYDEIVFSRTYGEPHMFTLFYSQYDPAKFQTNPNLNRFETYDWVRVLNFDKYYFPDLGDLGTKYADIVNQNPGKKLLFIGKPGDFPDSLPRLLTVNFLNGDKAVEVVESP